VPTLEALDRVIAWLEGGQVTALKTNQVNELHAVVRDPGGFLGIGGTSWEDCVGGVFLLGPPKRTVTLHNRRNLWVGTGAIRLRVSDLGLFAQLESLHGKSPGVVPQSATAEVFGVDPVDDFNDVISSFAFEPL